MFNRASEGSTAQQGNSYRWNSDQQPDCLRKYMNKVMVEIQFKVSKYVLPDLPCSSACNR